MATSMPPPMAIPSRTPEAVGRNPAHLVGADSQKAADRQLLAKVAAADGGQGQRVREVGKVAAEAAVGEAEAADESSGCGPAVIGG